jgi:hypothetical protein
MTYKGYYVNYARVRVEAERSAEPGVVDMNTGHHGQRTEGLPVPGV